jgi:hypothetical protein
MLRNRYKNSLNSDISSDLSKYASSGSKDQNTQQKRYSQRVAMKSIDQDKGPDYNQYSDHKSPNQI